MTDRRGPVTRRALFMTALGLVLFTSVCWQVSRQSLEMDDPAAHAAPSTVEPAAAQPDAPRITPVPLALRREPAARRRNTSRNDVGIRERDTNQDEDTRVRPTTSRARWSSTLLMAAAAFGLLPAPALAADSAPPPSPDGYQEVLVQLRFGRVLARTIPAYRHDDTALLPLSEFFRLAEITYRTEADSVIEAMIYPSGRRLRIAVGDTLVAGLDGSVTIGPDDLIERQGELYLATDRLAELLGLRLLVDWSELYVLVEDPRTLPLVMRLQRDATRRALLRTRGGEADPSLTLPAERGRWSGIVADYALTLPGNDPLAGSSYALAVGSGAFGGSLELGVRSLGAASSGAVDAHASWLGFWPANQYLRQLRLGSATSFGVRPRSIRGVSLSNSPFVRHSGFGLNEFHGRLLPGWEVEAYQSGQLVAFDSVDTSGRFSFELPIVRGENPVNLVAYGPSGEVRRFDQTYRVIHQLIPGGTAEYGLSAGQCLGRCDAMVAANVRYGINRRWTVGAGVDHFWRGAGSLSHPYVAVAGSPVNAVSVEVEAAYQGFVRAGLRYEPSIHLRLTGEHTVYDTDVIDPIITSVNQSSRTTLLGFYRPVPQVHGFYFDARADRVQRVGGSASLVRLGAAAQAWNVSMLPFVRLERQETVTGSVDQTYLGFSASVLPRRRLGPVLGKINARGTLEWNSSGSLHAAAVNVGYSVMLGTRINAGAQWFENSPGTSLFLSFSSVLGGVSSNVLTTAAPNEDYSMLTSFQGSAMYDPQARRIRLDPTPAIRRSGINGYVFLDENQNGLRDPEEQGLGSVRVYVGHQMVVTDSLGQFASWDALPLETIMVGVDTMSLASPLWIPQYGEVAIHPVPNTFTTVNVAIVEAGVIDGRVMGLVDGRQVVLGGVALLLTGPDGSTQRLRAFSDGGFYAMGLRPGTYVLTLDNPATERWSAAPLEFTVMPIPGGAIVEGLEIIATRRVAGAASP